MIKFKNLILEMISLPDIVYHGTVQDFDSFSTSKSNFRGTIYFTTDKNFAIEFAKDREGLKPIVYHCKLNINKVFDPEKQENLDLINKLNYQFDDILTISKSINNLGEMGVTNRLYSKFYLLIESFKKSEYFINESVNLFERINDYEELRISLYLRIQIFLLILIVKLRVPVLLVKLYLLL